MGPDLVAKLDFKADETSLPGSYCAGTAASGVRRCVQQWAGLPACSTAASTSSREGEPRKDTKKGKGTKKK